MLYVLNQIQFFLTRPWRYLFFTPGAKARLRWKRYYALGLLPLSTILYVLITPLRFVNAVGYNILIYNLATLYDHLAEILLPRRGRIRHKSGGEYLLHWVFGLPFRFVKHGGVICLGLTESVLLTLWETVFPTLTLYHGTSGLAGVSISQQGKWLVGEGNFAGSGIYFAISEKTARHYARWGTDPIIIKARVSLGFCYPLACAPEYIRMGLYGIDGDRITRWAQKHGVPSGEWWRRDTGWWEYVLFETRGKLVDTWRIRILYIKDFSTGKPRRIWGGKSTWMSSVLK
ncbi:MAG: hypothetical protein RIS47_108 [Bacteroidota bacterium]|jgi:hypothetical protein